MNFSPEIVNNQESHTSKNEHILIPVDIAIAFQTMLMKNYCNNKDGTPFVCNDTTMWEWSSKYGKAFRDFCNMHSDIACHINNGAVIADEEQQIYTYNIVDAENGVTLDEINELVSYIKVNPEEKDEQVNEVHESREVVEVLH